MQADSGNIFLIVKYDVTHYRQYLRAFRSYKSTHKNRKTILKKENTSVTQIVHISYLQSLVI